MPTKKTATLTRCDGTMTESAYLAWIRSALRSKSLRWGPRSNALLAARRSYRGPNKLQRWEYLCKLCSKWYKAKETCVDHYPVAAGSILSVADISQFCENLYCNSDNLRVLCVSCHAIHTLAEKRGITHEEAAFEKRVNERMKSKDILAYLAKHGYNGALVSNTTKRKLLVEQILHNELPKEK